MISFVTEDFIKLFKNIPNEIQYLARKTYKLWLDNPYHPSLQFKPIHSIDTIWSVRIGLKWRVLGYRQEDTIYWFWIGSHSDYNKMIDKL
jgi:hypothetical protein